jgi:hypothetical protein
MQNFLLGTLMALVFLPGLICGTSDQFSRCLPKDVNLKAIVQSDPDMAGKGITEKPLTVQQKLKELKARCKNGKLVDANGKEIYFLQLIGCWGNPPEDYQEQLEQQRLKLEQLKEKYTVVEISCNQNADLKEIH